MKGLVVPSVVTVLAVAPVAFAWLKASRRTWLVACTSVGAIGVAGWVACAAYGWGVTENMTDSLPGHVYVHRKGEAFGKGDLVAYRWQGGATYPRGTIFIKKIVGVPGDIVKTAGRAVWVGDGYVGMAKPFSKAGVALQPAAGGVIGEGEYFVATGHPDSLDSRYALSGNVKAFQIIGRAYEVF